MSFIDNISDPFVKVTLLKESKDEELIKEDEKIIHNLNKKVECEDYSCSLFYDHLRKQVFCGAGSGEVLVFNFDYSHENEHREFSSSTSKSVYEVEPETLFTDLKMGDLNHIIQWDESTLLACSSSSEVFSFSMERPFNKIKSFFYSNSGNNTNNSQRTHEFSKLLKLNDSFFAAILKKDTRGRRTEDTDLLHFIIYDYKTANIFKKFKRIGKEMGYNHDLRLSMNYENCFYVNSGSPGGVIRLIDWENEMIAKEFKDHEFKFNTYCIFKNRNGKEILCICQSFLIFYFYDTSSEKFGEKSIKIEEFSRNYDTKEKCERKPDTEPQVSKMEIINNQFIFCSSGTGRIGAFEITQTGVKRVKESINYSKFNEDVNDEIHNGWIYEMILIHDPIENNSIVTQITGSDDCNVLVSSYYGLKFRNRFEDEDMIERILFLKEQIDIFVFNEEEKKQILVDLKGWNFEFNEILKSFFYL